MVVLVQVLVLVVVPVLVEVPVAVGAAGSGAGPEGLETGLGMGVVHLVLGRWFLVGGLVRFRQWTICGCRGRRGLRSGITPARGLIGMRSRCARSTAWIGPAGNARRSDERRAA